MAYICVETRTHVERGWTGCTPGAPELRRSSFLPLDRHRFQDGGRVAVVRPRHTYRPILAATPPLPGGALFAFTDHPVSASHPPIHFLSLSLSRPSSRALPSGEGGEFLSRSTGNGGERGGETGAVVGSRDVRADIGIALGRRATFAPGNTRTTPSTLYASAALSVPSVALFRPFSFLSFLLSFALPRSLYNPRFLASLRRPLYFPAPALFSAPLKYSRFHDHACFYLLCL